MFNKMTSQACDIAIVGMGSLFPGAKNKNEFWNDIYLGIDRITDIPKSHWNVDEYFASDPKTRDKTYCKRGGFLPEVDFDPLAFGIPPTSLTATDTGQLLGLLVAKQTLDDVRPTLNVQRERVSVILGTTGATELITDMASRLERPKWFKAILEEGISEEQATRICERVSSLYPEWQESTFPGLLSNVIAGRIANRLDLRGSNFVTDAACASSLAALQYAIQELLLNQSDLVITGGVDTLNTIFMYMCFSKTPALSQTGDCKPFSENSDGTLIGEGIGMLALKRLEDAENAGDSIYAVIKGIGSSSDGLGMSIYAPSAEGQTRALHKAYKQAQYSPRSVELVEAHGTGTKAGDLCEIQSLKSVFKTDKEKKWCALGSVKSQIGHTKAAAGVAGLIKATLALQHKVIPPTLKVSKPHTQIQEKDSPFYINTQSKPWIRDDKHPRRASVSSFGFGGSNFHVTLEEYRGKLSKKKIRNFSSEMFFFGSHNLESLKAQLLHLIQEIDSRSSFNLLAEKNHKFVVKNQKYRLAFVCRNLEGLKNKIQKALEIFSSNQDKFSYDEIYFSSRDPRKKIAILFPGQGSQYTDMSASLSMTFDSAREIWDALADMDMEGSEEKLHKVVFPPSSFSEQETFQNSERLKQTEWAQPAIAASSLVFYKLLTKFFGIQADFFIGHSLGSLTALYAAGAYSLRDLIQIARIRGLLMSQTDPHHESGMLAVAASVTQCHIALERSQTRVAVANINAPEQTILSGKISELEKISTWLTENKIGNRYISVSNAFHSPQMEALKKPFAEFLNTVPFENLKEPAISGLTADLYPKDPSGIQHSLVEELCSPVQFMPAIEELYKRDVKIFLEVGPKNVLTKLCRKILHGQDFLALAIDEDESDGLFSLWNTLAQLAVEGVPVALENLEDEFVAPRDSLEKKSSFRVSINGANLRPQKPIRDDTDQVCPQLIQVSPRETQDQDKETERMDSRVSHHGINKDSIVSRLDLAKQLQLETARIHSEFQKTFSETHLAFLKSSENCFQWLVRDSHLSPIVEEATVVIPQRVTAPESTQAIHTLSSPPSPKKESLSAQRIEAHPPLEDSETFRFTHLRAEPEDEESRPVDLTEDSTSSELTTTLIEVISEKTGYPQELIKLEMSLDTDLGIDSIKRVEIFSQLADKVPQAGSIDPQSMNKLSTLQDIVDYLEKATEGDDKAVSKKKPTAAHLSSHSSVLNA
jgi:polyketide-type polyunsaturated fatty acid synthase PfaA